MISFILEAAPIEVGINLQWLKKVCYNKIIQEYKSVKRLPTGEAFYPIDMKIKTEEKSINKKIGQFVYEYKLPVHFINPVVSKYHVNITPWRGKIYISPQWHCLF